MHVRRTFWGETTLLAKRPNFSSFPEFEQTVFRILTRIFGQGGHNRILRAQLKFFLIFEGEKWRKKTSFWKFRISIIFRLWANKIFSTFAGMVTAGLSKIRCLCSDEDFNKEIFWKAYYFFPHFQKYSKKFSEFWENFGRVVTTTFIHVHRNISRKVIFLSKSSKFFFVVFGIWAANVWTLREKYLLPLSKLHSPLLKKHFWWKK